MNIRKIDNRFSITGQIQPEDLQALAEAGFRGVICARPDHEDGGQPVFAKIAAAAELAGLKAFHIPVTGALTQGQHLHFRQALTEIDGPILGYCRSGGRAGSLYQASL